MPKIGVIIQARMGSTRLPNKVMMDICGKPVLQRVLERASQIKGVDQVILTTYHKEENDVLVKLAWKLGHDYSLYSGPALQQDVLARYYKAASSFKFDTIVRITADCPMLDPVLSSQVLARFIASKGDYASNVHPPTWPDGLDTEVFSFDALAAAYRNARSAYDREHVTPFIYQFPSPFKLTNVWNDTDESMHRWTLDTQEDLDWIRTIYNRLGDSFGYKEVMALIEKEPELAYTLTRK